MKYQLRNFENNFQMVSSLGWIFILVSIIFIVTKGMIGFLLFTAVGVLLVWWQQRGGRISVDTAAKTIKNGSSVHSITQPTKVFMNKQRYSQNVNSRVSSTNVILFRQSLLGRWWRKSLTFLQQVGRARPAKAASHSDGFEHPVWTQLLINESWRKSYSWLWSSLGPRKGCEVSARYHQRASQAFPTKRIGS